LIQLSITCEACARVHTWAWSRDLGTEMFQLRAMGWLVPWGTLCNGQPMRIRGEQLCPSCREKRGLPREDGLRGLGIRRNSTMIARSEGRA
jgi:hypothetical protein